MVCVRRGMVGFMVCQGSSATAITSSLLSIIRTGGLSHLVPFLLRRATERQKYSTFRASPSTSLAAHQGGSPAWSAAPTAITASSSSSRRSSSARPELHCFTHRGDRGVPAPAADTRHPLPPPKQRASGSSFSACVRVRLGRQLVLFSLAVAAHEVPHRASKSVMCQSS